MSSGAGGIIKSDGQDYQAVTLNVNGVTKRVLVPLSSDDNDNFIPTPDNPFPSSKTPPVSIAPKPVPKPPQHIAPSHQTTSQVIRVVTPVAPPPVLNNLQQIQIPMTISGGQLVPIGTPQQGAATIGIQNRPTQITLPASSLNLVSSPTAPNVQMSLPRPVTVNTVGQNTVIQTGTLIQPNKINTGNTVQYGTIAMRAPAPPPLQQPNVIRPPTSVYQIDSSGRIQLVKTVPNVTTQSNNTVPSSQPIIVGKVVAPQVNTTALPLASSELRLPQPKPPQGLTLTTPDGKVFSVPDHLLPATVASALTTPAQPHQPLVAGSPVLRLPLPATTPTTKVSNVTRLPIPTATTSVAVRQVSKVIRLPLSKTTANAQVKVPFSQAAPTVRPNTFVPNSSANVPRPVNLPTSNSAQAASPYIAIAPKPTPGQIRIPMGVATIMPCRSEEPEVEKSEAQTSPKNTQLNVDTADYEKSCWIQRNQDWASKNVSPKAKHKTKDKTYRPPPNLVGASKYTFSSDDNRRRSRRIKTKPCSVVLKRLNVKRNATVNLNEIPIWLLG